ncbi:hypothetical protein E2C01_014199 [Portunus trituberculatus]|uniref:Uncharacterized protein n=1 Tax=Portunus trituberculatus TaxID=210409 RepID=A0A5B7DI53_PORTR|nr:hypothetical protein [Portunus trituberculatus]
MLYANRCLNRRYASRAATAERQRATRPENKDTPINGRTAPVAAIYQAPRILKNLPYCQQLPAGQAERDTTMESLLALAYNVGVMFRPGAVEIVTPVCLRTATTTACSPRDAPSPHHINTARPAQEEVTVATIKLLGVHGSPGTAPCSRRINNQ